MIRKKISLLLLPLAVLTAGLSIWGPEALAVYRDKAIVNQIQSQETETGTEGYRYSLGSDEKLYILARCLNSQAQAESVQNAQTRVDVSSLDYQELTGSYAMVVNRKDSEGQPVLEDSGIALCSQGIEELLELGILPGPVAELDGQSYSAVLYSAIDVPEPRNNVLVWKIALDEAARPGAGRANCLLEAYVDADTGKIYEFYARTQVSEWEEIHPDEVIEAWAEYMGLSKPQEYEGANPLAETTPYFKKYTFDGVEDGNTVVTIGFYEGVNELYLKISR